jgi:hypothetical protein
MLKNMEMMRLNTLKSTKKRLSMIS